MTTEHLARPESARRDRPALSERDVDRQGPVRYSSAGDFRGRATMLNVGAVLLLAGLVVAGTRGGLIFAAAGVGAAGLVAALALLGTERLGVLLMIGGFFTAPFYKGLTAAGFVTATDLLLFFGLFLLLPQLFKGRVLLPPLYFGGIALVMVAGLISSAASSQAVESFLALGFWIVVMLGLVVAFALWMPSGRLVDAMAVAFIAGHLFSFAAGIARGNVGQGRYSGLTTHPNYLAQAGMLALALLLYLVYRHFGRSWWISTALVGAGALCGATVVLSGSRAATLVVAVLVLMIPVVERSAVTGFLFALLGGLGLAALPFVVDISGDGSSIARLTGNDPTSAFSDSARTQGLEAGLDRFWTSPVLGDGLTDLFDIHNNFLEVAVAVGVVGLVGYLMVLWVLARPLFGSGEFRRLTYVVWAYIGFGATVPSLYDRSIWAVVALSVVAVVEYERQARQQGPLQAGAAVEDAPVVDAGVTTTREQTA